MAVTITSDTRKTNMWITGKVDGAYFEAKVFDEPSDYGIDRGRVSKLWIRGDGEVLASYDRGWDVRPTTPKAKAMVDEVVRKMKNMPVASNAMGIKSKVLKNALGANTTAKNATRIIGRPPADVKQKIERLDKMLELADPNEVTDRLSAEISATGWGWDSGKRAWAFNDEDIKRNIKWAFAKFMEAVDHYNLKTSIRAVQDKNVVTDFENAMAIARKYAR